MDIDLTGLVIEQPGIYDIPDGIYHADPVVGGSLSHTGARKLLPPSCPAKFRHWQTHPEPPKWEYDMGHAAHTLVLGTGQPITEITHDSWRTNAAKDAAADARDNGQVPLLTKDYQTVHAMADALRRHPLAAALLDADHGRAEQSLFWIDPATEVWLRARPDMIRDRPGQRLLLVDYKTTDSAHPADVERSVRKYGYYQQDPFYLDGVEHVGLDPDAGFVFVFQERSAPYLVTVVEIAEEARAAGRARNRRAIDTYAECVRTGHWPAYTDDIALITLPDYALTEEFTR